MSCSDEIVVKILGKAELLGLVSDQLKMRSVIEEVIYDYSITSKERSLISSDFNEKIDYYKAVKKLEGIKENTLDNYEQILRNFASVFNKPVSTITTADIRMYLAFKSQTLKNTSLNTNISTIKSFFSWLEYEDYIPKNPTIKIKSIKVNKRLRQALTEEELEQLRIACITDRERCLVEFAYSTGCRLSEIHNVNISDLNFNEKGLNVIGKGDKERTVYFSPKAKLLIKIYLKDREGNSEALFTSSRAPYGRLGVRGIQKEISNIGKRAKLNKPIYPHLLRHTFATLKLKAGMPITVIQMLMGHEDPSTTQIYAKMDQDIVKSIYRKTA